MEDLYPSEYEELSLPESLFNLKKSNQTSEEIQREFENFLDSPTLQESVCRSATLIRLESEVSTALISNNPLLCSFPIKELPVLNFTTADFKLMYGSLVSNVNNLLQNGDTFSSDGDFENEMMDVSENQANVNLDTKKTNDNTAESYQLDSDFTEYFELDSDCKEYYEIWYSMLPNVESFTEAHVYNFEDYFNDYKNTLQKANINSEKDINFAINHIVECPGSVREDGESEDIITSEEIKEMMKCMQDEFVFINDSHFNIEHIIDSLTDIVCTDFNELRDSLKNFKCCDSESATLLPNQET